MKTREDIKGIICAMVTPMHADESVDLEGVRRQTRRQIEAGVHGVFCLGTNGEGYILSHKEKLEVAQAMIDENAGRLPVYVGTGCVSTRETVELSREAERLGADVLSVVCPYFAAASQDELYAHFAEVAGSVSIPVLLYNIPMRTGVNLAVDTVKRLAQIPNIAGIKDSSGNFDQILQYIEKTPDDFIVLSGNDSLALWTLQAGGKGAICGIANLFPKRMVSIYERFVQGDFEGAKQASDSIRAIRDCFKLGNPNSIVKLALNLLGQDVGPCRRPFWTDSEAVREKLKAVLDSCYKGAE